MAQSITLGRSTLLALCITRVTWALDPRPEITQYGHHIRNIEDGLPNNSIRSMAQSQDGYLWILHAERGRAVSTEHVNGDREVLAQIDGVDSEWYLKSPGHWRELVRWTAQQLQKRCPISLSGWPSTCQLEIPGLGQVLFCHATPRNDTEIFTRLTPESLLLPIFDGLGVSLVVCGHTHMQLIGWLGRLRL